MTSSHSTSACILIPAYQPDQRLVALVEGLHALQMTHIVVVNDGSAPIHAPLFAHLERLGCSVISHPQNLGKGAALKSGFELCLSRGFSSVVTADADGQHTPADIAHLARTVEGQTEPVAVLGIRKFDGHVPLRSAIGNKFTRGVFSLLSGMHIADTQTGLRAFSADLLPGLIALDGLRYEFEMNVLLHLARTKPLIIEVPIQTIYLDGNASSHFRPVLDSVRIYSSLLRDLVLALSSFGLDIALFSILNGMGVPIVQATYGARAISGAYNFLGSKFFVFRSVSMQKTWRELILYLGLALTIATCSGYLVQYIVHVTGWQATLGKILVDLALYMVSFAVRRWFIFR